MGKDRLFWTFNTLLPLHYVRFTRMNPGLQCNKEPNLRSSAPLQHRTTRALILSPEPWYMNNSPLRGSNGHLCHVVVVVVDQVWMVNFNPRSLILMLLYWFVHQSTISCKTTQTAGSLRMNIFQKSISSLSEASCLSPLLFLWLLICMFQCLDP